MIKISYPPYQPKIKRQDNKELIFDEIRKQWVALTPEEWVRQNMIEYMVRVMQYPSALIAIEREIKLGELSKRFDVLVYDRQSKPWMMIECKQMEEVLSDKVISQVLRYNIPLQVPYILVTNGTSCFGFHINKGEAIALTALPEYISG